MDGVGKFNKTKVRDFFLGGLLVVIFLLPLGLSSRTKSTGDLPIVAAKKANTVSQENAAVPKNSTRRKNNTKLGGGIDGARSIWRYLGRNKSESLCKSYCSLSQKEGEYTCSIDRTMNMLGRPIENETCVCHCR